MSGARAARALRRRVLITGGAGFIGSNLAARLLATDAHVTVLDSLARPGVAANAEWLRSLAAPGRLTVIEGDVRDRGLVQGAAEGATEIYHFAAQVAVTTSLEDPIADCHTNILGTLHVLEAARLSRSKPLVLFTSTNKVYGSLESVGFTREGDRWRFADPLLSGIDEDQPLDFHSPYGCSKGAADQYVHDYARIYGLATVVFRMSCIAGPRQLGTEDQGWLAHFLYSALRGEPVTIYGDGCQVRDILHVSDLLDAMELVVARRDVTAGQVYNVGGGPAQSISVREALKAIEQQTGARICLEYKEARPGDQQIYVSDTVKLRAHTGWEPKRGLAATLGDIAAWGRAHLPGLRQEEPLAVTGGTR